MRLIDADALKEEFAKHEDRKGYLIGDWEEFIDNAPTVDTDVNCSYCDYFKFSKQFIENVVKFMAEYKIETVDDLMTELNHINEWLGGKE